MKNGTRRLIALTLSVLCLCCGLSHGYAQAQTEPANSTAPLPTGRKAGGSAGQAQITPASTNRQSNAPTSIVLLVSGSSSNKIHAYDVVSGDTLYSLGGENDPIRNPRGIAVGPDGLLYVASNGANKILRYNLTTRQMVDVQTDCPGCIQFQFAANGDPLVLVANYYNSNIDRYSNGKLTPFLNGVKPAGAIDMTHGPDGWLYPGLFMRRVKGAHSVE